MKGAPPDEVVLPAHELTPYLRVRIASDDRALTIERRHVLLGLIPLRRHRDEVPLGEFTSGRVITTMRIDCIVAAAAFVALALWLGPPVWVAAALGIAAALFVLLSPTRAIRVERTGGRSRTVAVCWRCEFDASVALLDAEVRRDDLLRRLDRHPPANGRREEP